MDHASFDLVALHQLVNNPLEALVRINHVNHQHSLESSMIVSDVVVQLVGASSHSHKHVILSKIAGELLSTNEVHLVILGVLHNWDSHIISLDDVFNILINLVALSRSETNWSVSKKFVTLLVNFFISKTSFHDSLLSNSFILIVNNSLSFNVLSFQELLFMISIISQLLAPSFILLVPLLSLVPDILLFSACITHLLLRL